ncbi:MAG TPA: hypothetical protein VJX68_00835 [Candidatus Binatus sp.]|nr:hypothetical protein [Candidatus Binatus sp.]HKN11716.1 hypothetical protein [Candidatus Binatus sp.]
MTALLDVEESGDSVDESAAPPASAAIPGDDAGARVNDAPVRD